MIYTKLKKQNTFEEYLKSGWEKYGNGSQYFSLFPLTYEDKEKKIRQCHQARRSFEDLLEIVQTEYPTITEKEVAVFLIDACKRGYLIPSICPTIMKWVFRKSGYSFDTLPGVNFLSYIGEETLDFKGLGKYSMEDIFKIIEKEPLEEGVRKKFKWN